MSDHSSTKNNDASDRASLKSLDTVGSISSGTSISKLKKFGARIRARPLPRYLRGSVRKQAAAEIEPARVGPGVWRDQLLSDRSLRGMAALTTAFAIAMIIVVCANAKKFAHRSNPNTSSVGGQTQSCKSVARTNAALLLLINVCATMVLGMSNTYQQLVTSLRVGDLKHALSKFGDSRVGTNSPFSIKHKKCGKKRAWASWCLLIVTSMPVHFLANSLIGPSYTQELPEHIEYTPIPTFVTSIADTSQNATTIISAISFPCWSAFRTGVAHYPMNTTILEKSSGTFSSTQGKFFNRWNLMQIHYETSKCERYKNDTINTEESRQTLEASHVSDSYGVWLYTTQNCTMGTDVYCTLHNSEDAKCRLNVRMSAAFTLMACLVLKAIYMCTINLLARGKLKDQCLTFGDVIVASASHPKLRVQGECMVNATDNFRRRYSHTCHKHCFNPEKSKTGDEIGHCQKCKKWNSNDKFADLPQPAIATKIKKSLINNLGSTALTQMCLLMFCSLVMLGGSITMAVFMGEEYVGIQYDCKHRRSYVDSKECKMSGLHLFNYITGGFGGGFDHYLEMASLAPDSLKNEFLSFSISNGAQFLYSLLYLMLLYNITPISQEHSWGKLEYRRKRLRSTLVTGPSFRQGYLLQLPKKILFPIMSYSVLTHWMLGEALKAREAIWLEPGLIEHSKYIITYAAYPLWSATVLILIITSVCWWAFTYTREGFIPQMYGSIRVLMASTSQLDDFPSNGVQWGDLGEGPKFRHAGLSAEDVMNIVPNELYAGTGEKKS
ncbi:hypothetical protein ACEQ8H_001674 [Pleosporales sp. CAS-2024a]